MAHSTMGTAAKDYLFAIVCNYTATRCGGDLLSVAKDVPVGEESDDSIANEHIGPDRLILPTTETFTAVRWG